MERSHVVIKCILPRSLLTPRSTLAAADYIQNNTVSERDKV